MRPGNLEKEQKQRTIKMVKALIEQDKLDSADSADSADSSGVVNPGNTSNSNGSSAASTVKRSRRKKPAPIVAPPENLPKPLAAAQPRAKTKRKTIPLEKVSRRSLEIAIYTDRNPWDYHPWETMSSFAGFQIYLRLMPHMRSVSRVKYELFKLTYPENEQVQKLKYEDWVKSDLNSSNMGVTTSISNWCSRYHWAERALAWDNHLAKIEQQALMEKRRKHALKCIEYGSELAETGMDAVRRLKDYKKTPSYDTSVRMVEAGIKLERTGLGLDETIAPQVNVNVSQKISVDKLNNKDLDQLVKIQARNSVENPTPGAPVIFNLENVIDHEDLV